MADAVECCEPKFWIYLVIVAALVCFAGMMSGLTLGLMSLDLVDLEVLIKSGRPEVRKHAAKILPVVKNGHLLLCTLLIGNSLAMEALPIFLDSLVPAWGAILISVSLILLFGEILPQAVCTRYGLAVGAAMAPVVRVILFLFFPIAYPISKLLDRVLGKGHMVLFRRAELKALVDMHGNEAGKGGELTHDETTIIGGALEMTEKTAVDAMTPISKTFSLNLDARLDVETMNLIMTKGHSRVPVYSGSATNILGIILVKSLLTLRPEDGTYIRDLTIRKIPRVPDHMPLYDILNEFQKGNSHIAVVVKYSKEKLALVKRNKEVKQVTSSSKKQSDAKQFAGSGDMISVTVDLSDGIRQVAVKGTALQNPASLIHTNQIRKENTQGGESPVAQRPKKKDRIGMGDILDIQHGSVPCFPDDEQVVGIITMEDVIEELLQEEILDETDEYIDVHNKIKVNMLASGRKSPLSSPAAKHQSGERSPLSSIQAASPSASSLSSFQHTPILRSPLSPRYHVPTPRPILSFSPSNSLPGSPLFSRGSRQNIIHEDGAGNSSSVPYEKLKKSGD